MKDYITTSQKNNPNRLVISLICSVMIDKKNHYKFCMSKTDWNVNLDFV